MIEEKERFMSSDRPYRILLPLAAAALVFVLGPPAVRAQSQPGNIFVQCPGDANGDAVPDPLICSDGSVPPCSVGTPAANPDFSPTVKCMHVGGGDGFIRTADDDLRELYIFSFQDLTGIGDDNGNGTVGDEVMSAGLLGAEFTAPVIEVNEGDELYLTLTNVTMALRPDLEDPHSIHYHGFPNAASIFDGLPDTAISVNMGTSFTYYYNNVAPGTYIWHCHVEATEHMQMGMLGQLFVHPAQNGNLVGGYTKFAYNDGDGSTGYDVGYAIQLGGMDPDFHDASQGVQPLPFAAMRDRYMMLNGRGYPDTVNPMPLPMPGQAGRADGKSSQPWSSLITADQGERILLRISNLNVTQVNTIATVGIPMRVVGKDARLLRRSPAVAPFADDNLYYETNSVTLGGGETYDVILDTSNVAPGTYFLYTTNLFNLSNNQEDFGGQMTHIVVNP
jgi:FtsP/CotA-like multicopper oxidase with cupredoxin domain